MVVADFRKIIPNYTREALYDHGLPFTQELALDLDDLKKRTFENRRHLPSMVIFDGVSGLGKTTGAVLAGSYLEGRPLDLKHQKGEGFERFLECAEWCIENGRRVVLYDEAGDFDKKATQTKANRAINRVFDVYRTFGIIVILILPNIGVLDSGPFDKSIPRLLVHLFAGNDRYTSYSTYSLVGMLWIRHHLMIMARKYPIKQRAYDRVTPNSYGHIKRPPDWLQDKIDKSSDEGKRVEIKKAVKFAKEENKPKRRGKKC